MPKHVHEGLMSLKAAICEPTTEGYDLLGVVAELQSGPIAELDLDLLLEIFQSVVSLPIVTDTWLGFIQFCLQAPPDPLPFIQQFWPAFARSPEAFQPQHSYLELLEAIAERYPQHLEILHLLTITYVSREQHREAIQYSQRFLAAARSLDTQVLSSSFVLMSLLAGGGYWQQLLTAFERHLEILKTFLAQQPTAIAPSLADSLCFSAFCLPYIQDRAAQNRGFHNQLAQIQQQVIQTHFADRAHRYQRQPTRSTTPLGAAPDRLRIGYFSHCLRQHSVGWLSRWLFQYHDRDRFQVSLYLAEGAETPFTQRWFAHRVDQVRNVEGWTSPDICDRIFADQIDILVDLDSLTFHQAIEVLALKPAPIQVSWLGWDASGIPNVDYFLVDPYVVPDQADDYYRETLWRLPTTYIAVDGFELGMPTLKRQDLDVPPDAVLYWSAQKGYKRHPHTLQLQMRILREVPNSYFLIKGTADDTALQTLLTEIAEAEGVSPRRLRFLPQVGQEMEHRADLQIADVVLDTFPYNGATTTLETLWVGIPMVTKVGQQFAARNSYAFMQHTGVTAGIAWSDEEYVEWGVRLGQDETLRQAVSRQLKAARHIAPIWNTSQFTRDLEAAFQQMHQSYSSL